MGWGWAGAGQSPPTLRFPTTELCPPSALSPPSRGPYRGPAAPWASHLGAKPPRPPAQAAKPPSVGQDLRLSVPPSPPLAPNSACCSPPDSGEPRPLPQGGPDPSCSPPSWGPQESPRPQYLPAEAGPRTTRPGRRALPSPFTGETPAPQAPLPWALRLKREGGRKRNGAP